ncbi:ribbon-helix-helix protein, CopG family [Georgenia sp. TF02-10]|uniref:ribbon-helix-helix protein, CopG family n=1 Tax=Georgenia sp. TF02-10 TaxID=2917725 RepID=UPI00352CCC85
MRKRHRSVVGAQTSGLKGMLVPMKRTALMLPDALHARLRQEAQRRGTTVGAIIRAALEAYLGPGLEPPPARRGSSRVQRPRRRLRAHRGVARSRDGAIAESPATLASSAPR